MGWLSIRHAGPMKPPIPTTSLYSPYERKECRELSFLTTLNVLKPQFPFLVGRSPSVIRQTKNRRWRGCSVRLPFAYVLPDEAEVPREVLVRSGKAYSLEAPSFGNYLRFSLSVLKFVSQIRSGHEFKGKQQPGRCMGIP